MKIKEGDKVKVVSIGPDSRESRIKYLGLIGRIEYSGIDNKVVFDSISDYHYFDDNELELVQGEKEMSAKFKVGDLVKVTASKEELKAINATECFEKVGEVVSLEPLVFKFTFNIPNEGIGQYFLNYAHAELAESKQAPKFKAGDLVRHNTIADLLIVKESSSSGKINCIIQTEQYEKEPEIYNLEGSLFEPVTELKVGDRIVLNPIEVEITEVEEDTSDLRYEVIFPNGLQMFIPNELVPTAKVQEKIEVGSIVMATLPDSKKQVFGQVTRDDQDSCGRYRVEHILDNKKDYNYFSGNDLTKIPKELFPDIKEVLGD